jgi:predicted DNA-binding transcriptional regulator AlpA
MKIRALTYLRNNNKEVLNMAKELFVRAEEVSQELGISKPYAYKLVREMNEELKQKGFITIPGRVSRRYFEEKFYGLRDKQ